MIQSDMITMSRGDERKILHDIVYQWPRRVVCFVGIHCLHCMYYVQHFTLDVY